MDNRNASAQPGFYRVVNLFMIFRFWKFKYAARAQNVFTFIKTLGASQAVIRKK